MGLAGLEPATSALSVQMASYFNSSFHLHLFNLCNCQIRSSCPMRAPPVYFLIKTFSINRYSLSLVVQMWCKTEFKIVCGVALIPYLRGTVSLSMGQIIESLATDDQSVTTCSRTGPIRYRQIHSIHWLW